MLREMLAAVALTAGVLFASNAIAQSDTPSAEEPTENAIVVHMRGPAATRATASAALLRKAQAEGQVRVFVELPLALRDEDTIAPAQAASQAQSLRAMQDGLLNRVLGAAPATNTNRVVRYTFIPFVSILVDPDQVSRLLADPQAVSIIEDTPKYPTLDQSVPLIKADQVWLKGSGFTGAGYSVAVIDTGVESTHSMLKNKVVSEACYSGNEPPNYISLCPGGKDFVLGVGTGKPCTLAGCFHGTHVASIAAGRTKTFNFSGKNRKLTGVAPGANIVAIQVFRQETRAAGCPGKKAPCIVTRDTDYISGMQRAYDLRHARKVAVVNMSLGGRKFDGFCDALFPNYVQAFDKLLNAGILVTVSSGNDKYHRFLNAPACTSLAVAVGNTTKADKIAVTSNHAQQVKLLAPGTDIAAAKTGNSAVIASGTSMAAPHVAGAVAVLKNARPKARADEILAALACAGKPVSAEGYNKPRIDVLKAYDFLIKPPTEKTVFNFSTASEASSWQPLRGAWSVSGGNYRSTTVAIYPDDRPSVSMLKKEHCHGSATIESRFRRLHNVGGYPMLGILYKATIGAVSKRVSGYLAVLYVGYGSVGATLYRLTNHSLTHPVSPNPTDNLALCTNAAAAVHNAYNTLKVVTKGGSHKLYVNGVKICEAYDFGYFGSQMALFTSPPYAGESVSFDYFKITPTDRAVPK